VTKKPNGGNMSVLKRHYLTSVIGLISLIVAVNLAGSHLSSVLQVTSFFIVVSASLGMTFLILKSDALPTLMFLLFRKGNLKSSQLLNVVEKSFFLGGIIGTAMGIIHAVINFNKPELIGPGVAVSFVCLTYSIIFNFLFTLPAKMDVILSESSSENQTAEKISWFFPLVGTTIMLVGIGVGSYLEGANLQWFISYSGLLLATGIPTLIGCVYFISSTQEVQAKLYAPLANIFISGGLISCIFHLINLMENLDKKEAVAFRAGISIVPLVYGLVGYCFCRLKTLNLDGETLKAPAAQNNKVVEESVSYIPYASFVASSLCGICILVIFAINIGS
jgi:flagellar motor component MotA